MILNLEAVQIQVIRSSLIFSGCLLNSWACFSTESRGFIRAPATLFSSHPNASHRLSPRVRNNYNLFATHYEALKAIFTPSNTIPSCYIGNNSYCSSTRPFGLEQSFSSNQSSVQFAGGTPLISVGRPEKQKQFTISTKLTISPTFEPRQNPFRFSLRIHQEVVE